MEELSQILKEKRVSLGLTIFDVSQKTLILQNAIEAIENNQLDKIEKVYMISFIKKYCAFLKIEPTYYNPIVDNLIKNQSNSNIFSNPLKKNSSTKEKRYLDSIKKKSILNLKINSKILNYSLIFALIAAGTFIIYYIFTDPGTHSSEVEVKNGVNPDTAVISVDKDQSISQYFKNQDSLVLEAFAIDTSWVKINLDGRINQELLMTPNKKKIWAAKNYIIVSQGNVGAIQFKRNGKLLEPFGSRGSIIKNVKITQESISY